MELRRKEEYEEGLYIATANTTTNFRLNADLLRICGSIAGGNKILR